MLGHNAILLFEYTSDSLQNFAAFQVTAFFVALAGMALMIYTGLNAHTVWDLRAQKELTKADEKEEVVAAKSVDTEPYWLKTWQVSIFSF